MAANDIRVLQEQNDGTFKEVVLTRATLSLGTGDDVTFRSIQTTPIGSITPSSGAFTTVTANNGTLTASAPVLNLAQTWNNSAAYFTGLQFNVTNAASNPTGFNSKLLEINLDGSPIYRFQRSSSTPYLFIGPNETGIGSASVFLTVMAGGGTVANFYSGGTGMQIRSDAGYAWASTTNVSNAADLYIRRDAANTLAQRNDTNAQTFNIYNTFTSSTNHERGFMRWSSNVLQIGTEKGSGGGTARSIEFNIDGTARLTIATNGNISGISNCTIGSTNGYYWFNRGRIQANSDGVFICLNNAGTDFGRLCFGDATSSYPALKRSSTALQVRLADDTGYTVLDAQLRSQGTAPATTGATGTAGDIRYDADYIYVCTSANTWKRVAIATW